MELVAQFCSTAWRSGNGYESTINFSVEGDIYIVCVTEFPTIFGLAPNGLHRHEVIIERTIADNELAPLYMPGNENNFGTTHGLIPEYTIFNNIFCNTLTPKRGDRTNIRGSTRNHLLAILDNQPPPCISTFLWSEMMNMLTHGAQYVSMHPTSKESSTSRLRWNLGMMASMELISLTSLGLPLFLLLLHPLLLL
jgi:hypothetical protein